MLIIKRIISGEIQENGYIIYHNEGGECYVIDPGDGAGEFLGYIDEHKLSVKAVLLTHHHPDHTGAVSGIVSAKGCPVSWKV